MNNMTSINKFDPNLLMNLPNGLKEELLSYCPILQIFSLLSASHDMRKVSRGVLILKAKQLGYACFPSSFEDAMRYIQTVFFTLTRDRYEKKVLWLFTVRTKMRSYDAAVQNERAILTLPRRSVQEKFDFYNKLDNRLTNKEVKPRRAAYRITKEHFFNFSNFIFKIKIPDEMKNKFSFTFKSDYYPKFSIIGMINAIITNEKELFFKLFKESAASVLADVEDLTAVVSKDHYDELTDDENNNIFHLIAFLGRKEIMKEMLGLPNQLLVQKCLAQVNASNEKPIDLAQKYKKLKRLIKAHTLNA